MSQLGSHEGLQARNPGELMRLVADRLTASGFDVRYPRQEDGRRLTITSIKGARCEISVGDCGSVLWDYSPRAGDEADPATIADMATSLLTGRPGRRERKGCGYERDGITLKGIVGLDLKARGLGVELEVFTDTDVFDAGAFIVATNPGRQDDAKVMVADDGGLTWERDYWPDYAVITWEPEYSARLTNIGEIAGDIAVAVKRATDVAMPGLESA